MNVLWDFDGTLFDTYPSYSDSLHQAMKGRVSKEDIYQKLKVSFGYAKKQFNITDEEWRAFKKIEGAKSLMSKPPFPEIHAVLKQMNLNVIMTHKERDDVEAILAHFGMGDLFVEIVAGDDGFKRKPDPESYRYLHNKHYIDLVVGDRELDILPGKALGIKTCLFQNAQIPGADFYLEDYRHFFDVIKSP